MATDLRGKFSNNRRREVNAVTATFPFVIQDADLRSGTAEVQMASGDYTGITLPANIIVTGVQLVVSEAFDSATSATIAATIGGVSVLAATNVKVAGLTNGTGLPKLFTTQSDLVATAAITGATTKGVAQIVVTYVDYARATMSYIGAN